MSYPCALETQPAQSVLYIRTRGPVQNLPQMMGEAFGAIGAYVGQVHAPIVGAPYALYHNLDMQDLDVEIGFPVAGPVPGTDTIQHRVLPAVRVATCLNTGPYDGIHEAYEALQRWMAEQGVQPGATMFEWYLNDPAQVKPEQLMTKIAWVLA
jgi:effector-binding domain-containing protein